MRRNFSIHLFYSSRQMKLVLLACFSVAAICLASLNAAAQFEVPVGDGEEVKWERHESVSGVFETKFPQNYQYKVFPFRFNNEKVAFSVDILSSPDGHKITKDNNIMIHAAQTFGKSLTTKQAKKILSRESEKYISSAEKIGGLVIENKDIEYKGFLGKNIYITYLNENGEKFGTHVRLYVTDYSKIEQVLTTSMQNIHTYRSDDFFESLKIYDGITSLAKPKKFGNGWDVYTSKNNVFTVKLPPVNADFLPYPPRFKTKPTHEKMYFSFVDPVTQEVIYYNVYSYKLDRTANYTIAKRILFSQHVKKYVRTASIDGFKTDGIAGKQTNIINARLIISPPKSKPYLTTLLLNGQYKDNIVVVQEILSSTNHAKSKLPLLLQNSLKFHPEQYKYEKQ